MKEQNPSKKNDKIAMTFMLEEKVATDLKVWSILLQKSESEIVNDTMFEFLKKYPMS